jgi:hypothetical protein
MPIKRRPPQDPRPQGESTCGFETGWSAPPSGRGARSVALRRLEVGTLPALTDRDERPQMRAFTLSSDASTRPRRHTRDVQPKGGKQLMKSLYAVLSLICCSPFWPCLRWHRRTAPGFAPTAGPGRA